MSPNGNAGPLLPLQPRAQASVSDAIQRHIRLISRWAASATLLSHVVACNTCHTAIPIGCHF